MPVDRAAWRRRAVAILILAFAGVLAWLIEAEAMVGF